MKKVFTLAALLTGISLATFAQEKIDTKRPIHKDRKPRMEKKFDRRTPEEIALQKTDDLDEKLTLSEGQRAELYALPVDDARRTATHREEMEKRQAEWHEDMKNTQKRIGAILTPEQQEQLKERYAQRRTGKYRGQRREFRKQLPIENQIPKVDNSEG